MIDHPAYPNEDMTTRENMTGRYWFHQALTRVEGFLLAHDDPEKAHATALAFYCWGAEQPVPQGFTNSPEAQAAAKAFFEVFIQHILDEGIPFVRPED